MTAGPLGLLVVAAKPEAKPPAAFAVQVTGTGRPMILIPGLSCGGNVWDGTMAHFKDRYQCHVLTLAGFAGQPPIGEPFLETVRDGVIKYIRDQKLERPVIVGHSLGGVLAFWLGATAPDQVGPIIAVDGVPFFPGLRDPNATSESSRSYATNLRDSYLKKTPEEFATSNRGFLAAMITSPEDLEKVVAVSSRSDLKTVAQAFYEIMSTDLRPMVKTIQSPVLLLGSTAFATDPDQRKAAEEKYRLQVMTIPRHKVVFAPKARHFIQLDEPQFFFQQVETFLKEAAAKNTK